MTLFKLPQISIDSVNQAVLALQESAEKNREQINNWHRAFLVAIKPQCDELAKFPDNMRQLLPYLLERGWYLSYELPIFMVNKCYDLMSKNKHDEIEDIMCKFSRSRIDNVKKELISFWPHRYGVLNDAFEAHSNGKYTLSIPVMIVQAEGIACEIFSIEQFFSQKAGDNIKKNEMYKLISVDGQLNIINFSIEASVSNKSIIATKVERDKLRQNSTMLNIYNRHEILHGEAVAYATEGNALRSVMLLDFLISLNLRMKESKKESDVFNDDVCLDVQ